MQISLYLSIYLSIYIYIYTHIHVYIHTCKQWVHQARIALRRAEKAMMGMQNEMQDSSRSPAKCRWYLSLSLSISLSLYIYI